MDNSLSKFPNLSDSIFSVMSALAHEHNAINLAQGFPNFDCDEYLKDLVYQYMKAGKNQYALMRGVPKLLDQIGIKIKNLYGILLDAQEEITITAGATQAIFTVIATLIRPGDEVIIIEPAYDSYAPSIQSFGGIVIPYRLPAPHFNIDWDAIESLCTPSTKLIIINTPHNPTGTQLTATDLQALWQIIKKRAMYVLSDEVYEHIVFDGQKHHSVVEHPALFSRSFAVFSFGKLFHNTGWKIGYCMAPKTLTREFRKLHQFNVFSVHAPTQYAIADYLTDPNTYLQLTQVFQQKRDYFLEKLKASRFKPLPAVGSYFILVDYTAISDLSDKAFAKWMTIHKGVASIPISPFYSDPPEHKLIRLCFAKTKDVLTKSAERLCKI